VEPTAGARKVQSAGRALVERRDVNRSEAAMGLLAKH
jgi:hypothetical protein